MHRYFLWLALLILLTASALRLFQLHMYPPGPHYDEAANLLIARSIAFDGAHLFPIANSYQGRETLYHYFSTPVLKYIVDDVYAFRLTSVFVNLLTIAASMALGRAMFRGRRGLVIGLLMGALMAVSFHQIFMSRQAYRAVTLPMMQALALLFLWHGLNARRRGWVWLVMGGGLAGGVLYTYMASRLFPVWLLLGGLALLLLDRAQFRRRLGQGALFFGALALAALPMALYALQNPDIFFQRLTEVSEGEVTVTLGHSIALHLEMFFIRGDFGNLRYNMPGRPYFTPIEGAMLVLGLALAAWRWLRPGRATPPTERSAYFVALLAPLMVIPSVVSLGGLPPSHMRSLGMVPLIFVLVAIGFEAALRALPGQNTRIGRLALPLLILAVLLVGGAAVSRDYLQWARRADLFYQADGDLAAAMAWLPGNIAPDDERLYIGAFHREHPTVISAWGGAVTWLGGDSLFLPPPGQAALLIFAHNLPPAEDWQAILAPHQIQEVPPGPDGEPAFWAYRVQGEPAPPTSAESAIRSPYMRFLGLRAAPIAAGEAGEITLMWQIEQSPPYYRLRPILDLINAQGIPLASTDAFLLGTDNWRPGEIMYQRMRVQVPPGTPPGDYPLRVTWVDRDSETYVSYINADGTHGGISAEIGTLPVTRPAQMPPIAALEIENAVQVEAAPGLRLLGWNPPADQWRPGETLTLKTFWQAITADPTRPNPHLELWLHADTNADDTSTAGTLIYAGGLAYPLPQWAAGELATLYLAAQIPHTQPAGSYALSLRVEGQALTLATVQVAGLPRVFEPIPVQEITGSLFGDELILHGYSIRKDNGVQLALVWGALATPQQDYTVFVHVLDANGQIITQQDAMPQQNNYPTSLWLPGEYVEDIYHFEGLAPGDYAFAIGLYLPHTGARLPVKDLMGDKIGDFLRISSEESAF